MQNNNLFFQNETSNDEFTRTATFFDPNLDKKQNLVDSQDSCVNSDVFQIKMKKMASLKLLSERKLSNQSKSPKMPSTNFFNPKQQCKDSFNSQNSNSTNDNSLKKLEHKFSERLMSERKNTVKGSKYPNILVMDDDNCDFFGNEIKNRPQFLKPLIPVKLTKSDCTQNSSNQKNQNPQKISSFRIKSSKQIKNNFNNDNEFLPKIQLQEYQSNQQQEFKIFTLLENNLSLQDTKKNKKNGYLIKQQRNIINKIFNQENI